MSSLSDAQIQRIIKQFEQEIQEYRQDGIRFAVAGTTGFGKTSTINALFNVNLPVNHAIPTTDAIYKVVLEIQNVSIASGEMVNIPLTIYDLPGIATGRDNENARFFQSYIDLLPSIDVVLWLLRAEVKGFETDINYISELIRLIPDLASRIVIGINYADAIGPHNWDTMINQPSSEQKIELEKVSERVQAEVIERCGITSKIVAVYSANKAWQLEHLFRLLIQGCPEQKRWVFAELKPNYRQLFLSKIPPKYRDRIAQMYPEA